jgi:hypothetical protein
MVVLLPYPIEVARLENSEGKSYDTFSHLQIIKSLSNLNIPQIPNLIGIYTYTFLRLLLNLSAREKLNICLAGDRFNGELLIYCGLVIIIDIVCFFLIIWLIKINS